jgi:hypothetical protein
MAMNRAEYRKLAVTPRNDWYVGLDVGQSIDPSAIAAINHQVTPGEWSCDDGKKVWRQASTERFFVRHLERLRLQTPYPEQVAYVANLLQRHPLKGATFALDYTGCGRPVADMFARAGLHPKCILITAGNEWTNDGDTYHVPKQFLVSTLESRLHSGELRIAPELLESPALRDELQNFTRKVAESGRVTYDARSGKHDDLILAICIALFMATKPRAFSSVEPFPF